MEFIKGLVMSLISTAGQGTGATADGIFARESRLASPATPTATQASPSSSQDHFADAQIKPTFQAVHQNLSRTLVRLIEDVKKDGAHIEGAAPLPSVAERIMTLSASTLVADLQLLLTVIGAKYL